MYINCKFTEDELKCISYALKFACNYHLPEMFNVFAMSAPPFHHIDIDQNDLKNYIIELRGGVKTLIRNSK